MKGGSMEVPEIITLDYLAKLDNGEIVGKNGRIGFPYLGSDIMIKHLFTYNLDFTKKFILNVCHKEDLNPDDCIIRLMDNEQFDPGLSTKKMITDFNVRINDNLIVNIESNRQTIDMTKIRNDLYLSRIKTSELKIGDDYNLLDKVEFIQLNLNFGEKNSQFGEDIIYSYSTITKTIYLPEYVTYVRNLDYYKKIYYNQDIKKNVSDYYLAILTAKSYQEFYKMLSKVLDKDTLDRLVRNVINFAMNNLFTEEELKALDKILELSEKKYYENKYKEKWEAGLAEGFASGKAEGFANGQAENSISIAKAMLNKNMDINLISELTGLSINKIKSLKKEL